MAKESEKKQKACEKKVAEALQKGNMEIVRINAANAVREKNQATNFTLLSSRMDAVAGRVASAIQMKLVRLFGAASRILRAGGQVFKRKYSEKKELAAAVISYKMMGHTH